MRKFILSRFVVLGCILSLAFSVWLMFHTFSYAGKTQEMHIAVKVWSDFGAHIPLIRSFSMGGNGDRVMHLTAPEYPIFPREPIRYHFLFYMVVGFLEKLGVRIDWALNIPSILGFTSLLMLIGLFSYWCFRSKTVSFLSILFFLFNGSFSFLKFFTKHPLSWKTPIDIITNDTFPSFGPWDNGLVSAFWNLNIYTNQRHLAAGIALGLLFIGVLLFIRHASWKRQLPFLLITVPILVLLPYFHQPMLIVLAVYMAWFFLVFAKLRLFLFVTGLLSVFPILLQIIPFMKGTSSFAWYPGYLIANTLTPYTFVEYWLHNLGLHSFLMPIGFLKAPRRVKLLVVPCIVIFIIANCFKFSVEIAANHKFFNFVMLFGGMLSAYVLVSLWHAIKVKPITHNPFIRSIAKFEIIGVIFFLVFSGIIDFFAVANDRYMVVQDIPKNEIATWIDQNTSRDAVFLNSSYLYHPASIAGRSIFLGWPYFSWSAGYDENRMLLMDAMYESKTPSVFCKLFREYNISYITVEKVTNDNDLPEIQPEYFRSLAKPVFSSVQKEYAIYSAHDICSH